MKLPLFKLICCGAIATLLASHDTRAQATVKETTQTLKTYGFSDPSPLPLIGRVYPYTRFEGYIDKGVQKSWKFVELENPYIKVSVTPEIGGKIWGAYDKATNFPFVYFNHVVKFRNVAMRGPWTSGGIELNFGDIGHAPTTATPVDYVTRTNADGSVSCFVGAWDWSARTRWTVEINLPKDKALFTTTSRWFNASPLETSYYHWMNAGFKSAGNLEFAFQGSHTLGHSGDIRPWPKDSLGRNLSFYENNNFGSYKSYHVLGKPSNFYGGYWHDDQAGFVHYAPYSDKLGQKIWVWGLSRQGMIWENLLTDTDGQYVELQSGRLFNQASGGSTLSPFKHVSFAPYTADSWTESWYPVRKTGGITAASEMGALYLRRTPTHLIWNVSPVASLTGSFVIKADNEKIFDRNIVLKTLVNYTDSVRYGGDGALRITMGGRPIFDGRAEGFAIDNTERPLVAPADFDWNSEYGLYLKGKDYASQRLFVQAEEWLGKCLAKNPYHVPALGEMAQLLYRKGLYEAALITANKALSVNTYDPLANYLRGLSAQQQGAISAAKDGFAVAVLSPAYRAAAFTGLAQLALREGDWVGAEGFVDKALAHQPGNDHARHLQMVILRKTNRSEMARKVAENALAENPLDHFARFEMGVLNKKSELTRYITNELPHEDYIEMALWYREAGQYDDALALLDLAPKNVMVELWATDTRQLATKGNAGDATELSQILTKNPEFVFPSRHEELSLLARIETHLTKAGQPVPCQLHYYRGILLWQLDRVAEAKERFLACGDAPKWFAFYLTKADLFKEQKEVSGQALERAHALAPTDWRTVSTLATQYGSLGKNAEALALVDTKLKEKNLPAHEQYILGQQKARLLLDVGKYRESVQVMQQLTILPNEGAAGAHNLFREGNIRYAVELLKTGKTKDALTYLNQAETWPENLGSGQPYNPDNRLTAALKAYAGDKKESELKKAVQGLPKKEQQMVTLLIE
jgi:tetratricopeptide (TPR) repeat protein